MDVGEAGVLTDHRSPVARAIGPQQQLDRRLRVGREGRAALPDHGAGRIVHFEQDVVAGRDRHLVEVEDVAGDWRRIRRLDGRWRRWRSGDRGLSARARADGQRWRWRRCHGRSPILQEEEGGAPAGPDQDDRQERPDDPAPPTTAPRGVGRRSWSCRRWGRWRDRRGRASKGLELLGRDHQDSAQGSGAVPVAALQTDLLLLLGRELRRVAERVAAVLTGELAVVFGPRCREPEQRADRIGAFRQFREERATLGLAGRSPILILLLAAPEHLGVSLARVIGGRKARHEDPTGWYEGVIEPIGPGSQAGRDPAQVLPDSRGGRSAWRSIRSMALSGSRFPGRGGSAAAACVTLASCPMSRVAGCRWTACSAAETTRSRSARWTRPARSATRAPPPPSGESTRTRPRSLESGL